MSKDWYPIIDYDQCNYCKECYDFCPYDVFADQDGKIVVVNIDNCVDFCQGCGKGACEQEAITFFGQDD